MEKLFAALKYQELTLDLAQELKEIILEEGITRNDVVKSWDEWDYSDLSIAEWKIKNNDYSAITHVFDMMAHGDL